MNFKLLRVIEVHNPTASTNTACSIQTQMNGTRSTKERATYRYQQCCGVPITGDRFLSPQRPAFVSGISSLMQVYRCCTAWKWTVTASINHPHKSAV
jgi:hypothetical protein